MVGTRIRQLRQKKGLTVTELAQRTSVSKSMISQVENDFANPSIETIRSIAAALEVPVFMLFTNQANFHDALVRKDKRVILRMPGSETTRELLTSDLQRKMVLLISRIPPRASSSPSATTHRGEECVFVLQGQVTVRLQDESYTLNVGDTFYFDATRPHLFTNLGDTQAEVLCAITPPSL